ncbi:hypothetical protein Pa4123_68220 [Phytohabitans aurantiacus]|uniref:DUF3375 domain-containing protein n=1 Tax=Phytohabitans aurantiacus TaxID=3016789 RepID=A0ABQ5R476_9ACTN|nr:hypothetical protein Pa4123_68220 [Phytohabitans aurantiacus]
MDELFDLPGGTAVSGAPVSAQLSAFDRTFPARVAVLMRSRPIIEAIIAANRQDWPAATYDIATFALAAIDLVIAQQGFAEEATYDEVVEGLSTLARRSAPERPVSEHRRVGEYTVDALLNRGEREAPFTYRISDFTDDARTHQQRQVQFRLLIEREDPVRGEVVLNATRDAINALVGGLEFDVEDEQVANEVLLERQLSKGAFDAAERAAVRARLLSVSLAEDLHELIKNTRRDLRAVIQEWATAVPDRLATAREHIAGRMEAEHRLLAKVRESLESDDQQVTMAAARIAALLTECSRRHDALHRQVIAARGVFLEEHDRQSFRPPALGHLPDVNREVLTPLLGLDSETALAVTHGPNCIHRANQPIGGNLTVSQAELGTMEETLAATEREVEAALRGATVTVRELKRALGAARSGHVRDLRKSLAAARDAANRLADDTRGTADGFDLDEQAYLSSGGYVKELLAEAETQGLSIVEDDDRLLCYPSLLRVLPSDAAVEVDKVRDRRLRPSVLVAALARAQERGPRFKAEAFLDSLRSAYELLVSGTDKRDDAVIRLVDIWSVLTMLPGQRGQYSKQEFARDLYLLDQSGVTHTARSPRTLRWAASTGTKGSGTLVTVARNGQQQRYWGISFTEAPR